MFSYTLNNSWAINSCESPLVTYVKWKNLYQYQLTKITVACGISQCQTTAFGKYNIIIHLKTQHLQMVILWLKCKVNKCVLTILKNIVNFNDNFITPISSLNPLSYHWTHLLEKVLLPFVSFVLSWLAKFN